ncbi:hypothetical protein HDU67_003623, partial [Dinochytrium kinnereticum]
MNIENPADSPMWGADADEENVSLVMAGVVLASLQLEMMGDPECSDVAGFLITDDAPDKKVVEQRIVITSFVPWTKRPHDRAGNLDMSICGRESAIVGLFRFRRNTRPSLSLRESALYDSLAERTTLPKDSAAPHHHVIGVFTSETNEPSTINFEFSFFRRPKAMRPGKREPFVKVPVVISNLVESTQTDQEPFIPSFSTSSTGSSSSFANMLNSLSMRHVQEYSDLVGSSLSRLA